MDEHVEIMATITNRQGETTMAYSGSLPRWAWDDPEAAGPWKKVKREMLLADRTSDPRGWRVAFRVAEVGI